MLCLALGISGPLCAQVNVGLKAGYNRNFWTAKDEEPGLGNGYHGGLYVEVDVSTSVMFRPELLYIKRGFEQHLHFSGSTWDQNGTRTDWVEEGEATVDVDYVELPLLVGLQMVPGFWIQVGPVLAVRTSYSTCIKASETFTTGGATTVRELNYTSTDARHLQDVDYGVAVGLNHAWKSGLNVGARYMHGLASTAKESPKPITYTGIQVYLGWTFHFDQPFRGKV
jgi:hypothetical protein